jgi:outer membrane lipoprotein-sorting protein
MRFAVLALFLLVPALAAQDNEAEKLLRQVEKKLAGAKSLKVVGELDASDEPFKMKATVLVAGNKLRLDMKGAKGDREFSMEAVSDGKMVKSTSTPPGKTQERPAPKNLGPAISQIVGRAGVIGLIFPLREKAEEPPKEINVDEMLPVSDFKMGKAEKVNGRDARVITYKVSPRDEKNPAMVTLWLDAKTLLPLKHVLEISERGKDVRLTATYTTFEVNPKIDPKAFEPGK